MKEFIKMIKNTLKKIVKLLFGKTHTSTFEFPRNKSFKKLPWVSFIIPARNEEKSIGKCIGAIVKDNYPKTEIIVIDDLSSDDTINIVKGLQKKYKKKVDIKLIINKRRLGPSPNRNKGYENSKGKILIMYDAHSVIDSKNFVKTYLKYFQDKNVGAVAGYRSWIPKYYQDQILYYTGGIRPWREMRFQFLDNPNAAFRRSAFKEMGKIDTKITWGSDLSNTFKILSLGYKIPSAMKASVTIDHSITPNRQIDFIRKPFLYGTVMSYIVIPFFKLYWKRRIDLMITFGGLINLSMIILSIFLQIQWWIPLITISVFRAHSLAFAIYNKIPLKYFIGIPIILTISEISYGVGFLYGTIRNFLGLKSFTYRKN